MIAYTAFGIMTFTISLARFIERYPKSMINNVASALVMGVIWPPILGCIINDIYSATVKSYKE